MTIKRHVVNFKKKVSIKIKLNNSEVVFKKVSQHNKSKLIIIMLFHHHHNIFKAFLPIDSKMLFSRVCTGMQASDLQNECH
jgi:L-cysteine desulfidase